MKALKSSIDENLPSTIFFKYPPQCEKKRIGEEKTE
jgi:hypothetical protein